MVMLIHLHIVMVVFTLQWQLNKFSRHQMVGKSTILFGPFQKKTVKLWSRFPFYPKENVNLMPPTTILSEAGCWLRTSWSLSCLSLLSSFSLTSSWLMRICEWTKNKSSGQVTNGLPAFPPQDVKYKLYLELDTIKESRYVFLKNSVIFKMGKDVGHHSICGWGQPGDTSLQIHAGKVTELQRTLRLFNSRF